MIRPATRDDASRIAEILIFAKRVTYRPIFQNDFVSFGEMQVLDLALSYQNDPAALDDVFVLEEDGIVKDMMRWDKNPLAQEGAWELKELYVDLFFQGHGIGTQLMQTFVQSAKDSGICDLFLWVLEKNKGAVRFYETQGFCDSGAREPEAGTAEFLRRFTRKSRTPEQSKSIV